MYRTGVATTLTLTAARAAVFKTTDLTGGTDFDVVETIPGFAGVVPEGVGELPQRVERDHIFAHVDAGEVQPTP